ncbi:conserved hypothetical protein [Perkinsus marinus ATCC 50983]|uniref:SLC41A/MgtE integral membrane domain-containing protein n=1 Tax=Perkinsus marinus (strain ATCC 50983 / TXsc) TaxID=423536 RepID=C5L9Z8_PERM5|nr:conserved hypothetical protein [Perkinsus marinus ATCC 50983]EER06254.1 conserved hypothetical protein [Perkinsus marinus ATCC 50983]|eukprot:XP_002774438.1 conserved hypothetical protein [Perkinsus marinus ATCC 50983]
MSFGRDESIETIERQGQEIMRLRKEVATLRYREARRRPVGDVALAGDEDDEHSIGRHRVMDGSYHSYRDRILWLLGLLLLQSLSSFVLSSYSTLLTTHPVIIYFLTMLVGAGGNAGSQSAVLVVRRLALGQQDSLSIGRSVTREIGMAMGMAVVLGVVSAVRTLIVPINDGEQVTVIESIAISISMMTIVLSSILLGTLLPLLLHRLGSDPAHAGAAIQVLMDILGVLLTCSICDFLLLKGRVF